MTLKYRKHKQCKIMKLHIMANQVFLIKIEGGKMLSKSPTYPYMA